MVRLQIKEAFLEIFSTENFRCFSCCNTSHISQELTNEFVYNESPSKLETNGRLRSLSLVQSTEDWRSTIADIRRSTVVEMTGLEPIYEDGFQNQKNERQVHSE
ncbi:unnamed protein product [Blepharisma stoltei]|uniref:Uncharacterized protein n=1 Tax=Blepharisma stoltei TaxID=1481888 RepID=A0AAU9JX51_9CILI|nr:unnamed protein product [Blepharisma stoltei]